MKMKLRPFSTISVYSAFRPTNFPQIPCLGVSRQRSSLMGDIFKLKYKYGNIFQMSHFNYGQEPIHIDIPAIGNQRWKLACS